jgi:hypothetical protein
VLDWEPFDGDGFHHYLVLRSASSTIPTTYPPQGGVRRVDRTYTTSRDTTDGFDRVRDGGTTAHYRAIAFGAGDHALAASSVRSVKTTPVERLGALAIAADGSSTAFGWDPYAGPAGCYSTYKLAYSAEDSTPNYVGGASIAWSGSEQQASTATVDGLAPGTYWFRLQAIRATSLGNFVVAQSSVVRYTVP